jgi:tetratricopeptide (TPR) repeat protein
LEALNGKAIALQHMFSYKEALDVLEEAMKIDNKHPQTLLSIAVTLQKLKQYDRSISFFKKVLSGDKFNTKAWNGIGVTYQLMGDNDSALKCFTKILNINSSDLQAWISIGYVYQKMFKFKDALKCYKKAQTVVNGRYTHKLYDGLASCLTKLSEFDQAIEVYKVIYQSEEGKRKWDAQRSIKFVNKLKRKQAIGALPDIIPHDDDEE